MQYNLATFRYVFLSNKYFKIQHFYWFWIGADDLKGKILQHRGGPGRKAGEADILMNLFILVRQAEHEMKNGDPNVCSNSIL